MPQTIHKPAGLRLVKPHRDARRCSNCRFLQHRQGDLTVCLRDPEKVNWSTSSGAYHHWVCGNWKSGK